MRNLMGRLNDRTGEELQRISLAWLLPGSARDRAGAIAQLMRAMLDLRAARSFWMRRPHEERDAIARFVTGDAEQGMTVGELAERLGRDETVTRAIATRLYQAGVLATATRQQPLAIGQQPRLFMPRELAQLFARIQDELDAGDISQAPLPVLLEMLDDADIQRAAVVWELDALPGLRTRRELSDGLLELFSFPDRQAAVERTLGWDARRILARVAEQPNGQVTRLGDIVEAVELDPDHPRTAERLRIGLTELEESLLVWHTFLPDGGRGLFQPIWQPMAMAVERDRMLPPAPVGERPEPGEARHPAALAWDLLTLLRWLGAGAPAVTSFSSTTVHARNRVNERCWNRGRDEPLPGYLEFLTALAEQESLLDQPGVEDRGVLALRKWRDRSFSEQMGQLLFDWLGAVTWIEARDQEEVVVSGAHWPQFRRRLLVLLPELESERWYRFDELTRWLSRRSGGALGDAVQIATSRPVDASLDRAVERLSSLEQVVECTLRGAFAWFGLVEIAHIPVTGEVVRVTEAGLVAAGAREPEAVTEIEGSPLAIHPDLTVTLRAPSPVRVWSLTAFADQVRLRPEVDYRITNRSLKRALDAGFRVDDVVTFLERQSGELLEAAARAQLDAWSAALGQVWLVSAFLIRAEQEDDTQALRPILEAAGLRVSPRGTELLVQGDDGVRAEALAAQIEAVLQASDRSPQFRATPETLSLTGEPDA